MKKIAVFALVLLVAISLCSCSVIKLPENPEMLYFAYEGKTDSSANLVFLPAPSSGRMLEKSVEECFSADNLPVYEVQTMFFANGTFLKRFETVYNNFFAYFSLWENKIFAVYFPSPYESGISKADLSTFINRFSTDFPKIKIIANCNSEAESNYYSDFDMLVVSRETADIYSAKTCLLKTSESTQNSDYSFAKSHDKILGLVSTDGQNSYIGNWVLQNKGIDFAALSKTTVEYFGYYHSNGFAGSKNFYAEVAALGNSNVSFVESGDVQSMKSQLNDCLKNGFKPLIYINFFFDWTAGLKSDWKEVYAEYKKVFDEYRDEILGFYADEPKWNNGDEAAFRMATKQLRDDFPEKKMLAILAYPTLDTDSALFFEYCSDLGYDVYKPQNSAERFNYLAKLINIAKFGQSLWLVPWACGISSATEEMLVEDILRCYEYAEKYDRIVGLLAFTYADSDVGHSMGDWGKGFMSYSNSESAYYMPDLTAEHLRIGKEIIGN